MPAPETMRDFGYMDDAELARLIDCKTVTLRNWRCAGTGPPFTRVHGGRIVYPIEGVRAWLAQRTVRTDETPTLANGRRRRSVKQALTAEAAERGPTP